MANLTSAQVQALNIGLQSTLQSLQANLQSQVFADALPVIGANLADSQAAPVQALAAFASQVDGSLAPLTSSASVPDTDVAQAITGAAAAAGFSGVVQVTTIGGNPAFDLSGLSYNGTPINVKMAEDLGLPGLHFTFTQDAFSSVDVNYDMEMKVGVDGTGFFVDTAAGKEMAVEVTATGPKSTTQATLGPLPFTVNASSTQAAAMTIDINLTDGDGRLRPNELAADYLSGTMAPGSSATPQISLSPGSLLENTPLDGISATLGINWDVSNAAVEPSTDNSAFGAVPAISLANVKLDGGAFFDGFVGNLFSTIQQKGKPFFVVADALASPVPGLSDILGQLGFSGVTMIDVLRVADGLDGTVNYFTDGVVDTVKQIAKFSELLDSFGSGGSISYGGFNFTTDGVTDARSSAFNLALAQLQNVAGSVVSTGDLTTFTNSLAAGVGPLVDFPLLRDPSALFGALLGRNVDLFTFNAGLSIAPVTVAEFDVPILPPFLNAGFTARAGFAFQVGMGFDTFGITNFINSGNPGDLFDGFYFTDFPGAEAEFIAEFGLQASGGIPAIFEVGVEAGIRGTVGASINSALAPGGKLRWDAIDSAQSFSDLFTIGGSVSAYLSAFVDSLFYSDSVELGSITLAEFKLSESGGPSSGPSLATQDANGKLTVLVGSLAPGAPFLGRESIRITPKPGSQNPGELIVSSPKVSAFGNSYQYESLGETQYVSGVTSISMKGGSGEDILRLSGAVKLKAIIGGGDGGDTLAGGGGDDTINGDGDSDELHGGGGNDFLIGGEGFDRVYGDDGADIIYGGDGSDKLYGGNGNDKLYSGEPNFMSNNPNEFLYGGPGGDFLFGSAGIDFLDGGPGIDTLDGGSSGFDRFYVDHSSDKVLGGNKAISNIYSTADFYKLPPEYKFLYLESVYDPETEEYIHFPISGQGNEIGNFLTGNDAANTLKGMGGDDTISGGDGDDFIDGGTGADSMTGGSGDDTFIVDNASDNVDGGPDIDTIQSSVGFALQFKAENLELTGTANINGTGDAFDNIIKGNSGKNTLTGADGVDHLYGGKGDTLIGGNDNDFFHIDSASVTIFETNSDDDEIDEVISSVSYSLPTTGFVENLTLIGSAKSGGGNVFGNLIVGNDSANELYGASGSDILNGGLGNDVLWADRASGKSAFSDEVRAAFFDTLDGGSGNDRMYTGLGGAYAIGGTGEDTYIIDAPGVEIEETANGETDTVETIVDYTLPSGPNGKVERLILKETFGFETFGGLEGGAGGFQIISSAATGARVGVGNELANEIIGNSLNNELNGGGGNDLILGGAGDDIIDGGQGSDLLYGGPGKDTFLIDSPLDTIIEGSGTESDTVVSTVSYTLPGYVENLTLASGAGHLTGTGNTLDNSIRGNEGNNTLRGGAGTDALYGKAGNDTMEGGTGDDFLYGGEGADVLRGESGKDVLDGGTGDDSMTGGEGDDTYFVDSLLDSVTETDGVKGGKDTVLSSVSFSLGFSLENLELTGNRNTDAIGNPGANFIFGNSGANVLDDGVLPSVGAGGPAPGKDTLEGGDGNDIYKIHTPGAVITERAPGGTDAVYFLFDSLAKVPKKADGTFILPKNVEYGLFPASGAIINGSSRPDGLLGDAGDNTLIGGGDNDWLDGGGGNNILEGGPGDDIYVLDGSGLNTIVELPDGGRDSVRASVLFNLQSAPEIESLLFTEAAGPASTVGNDADNLVTGNSFANVFEGGEGKDTLLGMEGNDVLYGNGGNDILDGGKGGDLMNGGIGDDTYYVDSTDDFVTETDQLEPGAGIDTVFSSINFKLPAGVDNLTLVEAGAASSARAFKVGGRTGGPVEDAVAQIVSAASAATNGMGNFLDNVIIGNSAANKLVGSAGNDRIDGGLGDDIINGTDGIQVGTSELDHLTGGKGKDKFFLGDQDSVYYVDNLPSASPGSAAIIMDFNPKEDRLYLHGLNGGKYFLQKGLYNEGGPLGIAVPSVFVYVDSDFDEQLDPYSASNPNASADDIIGVLRGYNPSKLPAIGDIADFLTNPLRFGINPNTSVDEIVIRPSDFTNPGAAEVFAKLPEFRAGKDKVILPGSPDDYVTGKVNIGGEDYFGIYKDVDRDGVFDPSFADQSIAGDDLLAAIPVGKAKNLGLADVASFPDLGGAGFDVGFGF